MNWRALLSLCVCLVLAGCEIPAQTFWSPDGSHAAYVAPANRECPAMLIDDAGKVLANLGPSTGGFAWSNDSKRLYFATVGCNADAKTEFETRLNWLNTTNADDAPPDGDDNDKKGLTVSAYQDGKTTPLFWLGRGHASHMILSPDQNWLALVYTIRAGSEDSFALCVYSIASRTLYPLSVGCTRGICFTGPRRLAFVEAGDIRGGRSSGVGQLVEVTLADSPDKLERQALLAVLMQFTSWLQAAGEDVLLTTLPFTFPAPPPRDASDVSVNLYRYSRARNATQPLATNVDEYFLVSPDGKRVLLGAPGQSPDNGPPTQLAVLELGTGIIHPLCNLSSTVKVQPNLQYSGIPAYPAWRGGGEISFTSPPDANKPPANQDNRLYFELALYRLGGDHKLVPLRTLSESWPVESKPSISKKQQ
jgi:hypothetical protein